MMVSGSAICVLVFVLTTSDAQKVTGASISYSSGLFASVGTSLGSSPLGVRDDPSDQISKNFLTGVLWVNNTASSSSGWSIRFGFVDKDTVPSAVVSMSDSVYVSTLVNGTGPVLYKYNATDGKRSFTKSIGSSVDRITHMAARKRSGTCDELVAVLRIDKSSVLLPANRDGPCIAVLIIDACSGESMFDPVLLDISKALTDVAVVEVPQDISIAEDGSAAYVAKLEARRDARVTNLIGALYRIDLTTRSVKREILGSAQGVLNVRVHAIESCVFLAVDTHPILVQGQASEDAVKVYRFDPVTLNRLEWGTEKKLSAIEPEFSVKLPERENNRFTNVVDVGYISRAKIIVLLVMTYESEETWNDAKVSITSSPAVRLLMSRYGYLSYPFAIRQPALEKQRPIFLFVNEKGQITGRIGNIRSSILTRSVLPNFPVPAESNSNAAILPTQMNVDSTGENVYVVGTIVTNVTQSRLYYSSVKIGGQATPMPSPTPPQRRVCVGESSTDYDGTKIVDIVRHTRHLRMQWHPRRWFESQFCWFKFKGCEDAIPMLCMNWPKKRGRLCATDGHIVKYNGKLQFFRDFCGWPATSRCVRAHDRPFNFKGPCNKPILVAHDLELTQHAGDLECESAEAAVEKECALQTSARISWTLQTL